MKTYFAPPEKASESDLNIEIQLVSRSPIVSGLLHSASGFLAVLNEQRQILALNDSFLRTLGIEDPEEALGLRPGEAFDCIHAEEDSTGCGTTKFCSTCGAAVAIVTSLSEHLPVERLCALTARRDGRLVDIALLIRTQPITVDGKRLLLLLAHDVTVEQRRAALERTFFHDINNLLSILLQSCEVLTDKCPNEATELVTDTAKRLHGELAIQRHLTADDTSRYRATWRTCGTNKIANEIKRFFVQHPAAQGKQIECDLPTQDVSLTTDTSALFRVLCNMVLNALEATENGGTVRLWVEPDERHVAFCVWNKAAIPDDVQRRLFQRNFSTKAKVGRGIGTFSMKLLGEDILGGRVGFTSSAAEGTVFRFTHPIREPSPLTHPEGRAAPSSRSTEHDVMSGEERMSTDHPIFEAVKNGDLAEVKRHLSGGDGLDVRTPINETPLILAAAYGHLDIVAYLVEQGADINAQYDAGNTPLIVASWEGHSGVVACLLQHGADVHIKNKGGDPALAWAAEHGHLDIVKQLLAASADIEAGNPLTCACENGHLDVAKHLLAHGADIETKRANQDGFTPLVAAAYKGYADIVQFLLDQGADVHAGADAPLGWACGFQKLDIAEILVAHGANVNGVGGEGLTFLEEAVAEKRHDVVQFLEAHGARQVDITTPCTPTNK